MLQWLQQLFSQSATRQVEVIEQREVTFEERLQRIVDRSRGLKSQSDADLAELMDDIDAVLSVLESAITMLELREYEQRAAKIRTRLRKVRTRAQNLRNAA